MMAAIVATATALRCGRSKLHSDERPMRSHGARAVPAALRKCCVRVLPGSRHHGAGVRAAGNGNLMVRECALVFTARVFSSLLAVQQVVPCAARARAPPDAALLSRRRLPDQERPEEAPRRCTRSAGTTSAATDATASTLKAHISAIHLKIKVDWNAQ